MWAAACAAAAVVALTTCLAAAGAGSDGDWTTYGDSPARISAVPAEAGALTRHFVLPLDGRITGQVLYAAGAFFAATTSGEIVSFDPDGYVRWRVDVGQLAHTCAQLDGYGVVGTGVVDAAAKTLYVADAFGRLHALALATGAERAGWPVRVFTDYRRELAWGALALVDGAVYVPTAAYCDSSSLGGVFRVDAASRQISRWTSVPSDLGGGGGPWGWGGVAFDQDDDQLFAATSGAFAGGSNSGDASRETAGYGERLVQLGDDLGVEDSSHPADLPDRLDLDFVGSPVAVDRTGCGGLVVGGDEERRRSTPGAAASSPPVRSGSCRSRRTRRTTRCSRSSRGTVARVALRRHRHRVRARIQIAADCSAEIVWRRPLGTDTENGSPTIAGDTVWFAVNGANVLDGYDARSGDRVAQVPLGGTTLEAPTIVDHSLVVGTFTGLVEGFSLGPAGQPAVTPTGGRLRRSRAGSASAAGRAAPRVSSRPTTAASRGGGSTPSPRSPSRGSRRRPA